MILQIAIWEIQTMTRWLPGGLPREVIALSMGPTCLYKQKLNFGEAPFLVAQPMRLLDSGAHVTAM